MEFVINNNEEKKQFELIVDDNIAYVEYILAKDKIFLTHTEVPKNLVGKGIGSKLVKAVLHEVDDRKLILIPLCPFVAGYIKRHPEWKRLVFKGIKIE